MTVVVHSNTNNINTLSLNNNGKMWATSLLLDDLAMTRTVITVTKAVKEKITPEVMNTKVAPKD